MKKKDSITLYNQDLQVYKNIWADLLIWYNLIY